MSLAHAPNTTCPRCLELRPPEIHTCSPTDKWRELETERDRYREALEEVSKVLTVPAAEYVPAIPEAWKIIDRALGK